MKQKYWIEIQTFNGQDYFWWVKCINGRVKCRSKHYTKRSLCVNDAKAFAEYTGLNIRKNV